MHNSYVFNCLSVKDEGWRFCMLTITYISSCYSVFTVGTIVLLACVSIPNTYSVSLYLQLAMTPIFGWQEVGMNWRVELRYAPRDSGEQCVMTPGTLEMQVLPADSLVSPQNVSC